MVANKKIKKRLSYHSLGIASFWLIFSYGLNMVAVADTKTEINPTVLFQPPPEESQPEKTEGAASRGSKVCSQDMEYFEKRSPMIAVVPNSNYGLTIASFPTFWVYLPETSAQKLILTIREKGHNPHWQQSVDLPKKSGIMGIKLSDDAPILEVDKEYQWAVILMCDNKPHPNDPVVTAGIKRVEQSKVITDNSFENYTALEKAEVYAKNGIWYDTLNLLVAEKYSLSNWDDIWVNYLQSAGLNHISSEQVIE